MRRGLVAMRDGRTFIGRKKENIDKGININQAKIKKIIKKEYCGKCAKFGRLN